MTSFTFGQGATFAGWVAKRATVADVELGAQIDRMIALAVERIDDSDDDDMIDAIAHVCGCLYDDGIGEGSVEMRAIDWFCD